MNNTTLQQRHKTILKQQKVLDKAKSTLKKEFIGLNNVIEEIVDSLSPWYLFPDLQEKPVIINLWGLTGVGKSSLVKRLSELLKFENKYYHFDLGDNDDDTWSVKKKLEEMYENANGYPAIISLDEFQHARTINEQGDEIQKSPSRIIWQLLDSGKFQMNDYNYLEDLYTLIQKLNYMLEKGVKVEKGKVIEKKEFYLENMGNDEKEVKEKAKKDVFFIPTHYYGSLLQNNRGTYVTTIEIKEKVLSLNGYDTIEFLVDAFYKGNSPQEVDCSKSLMFVLGNLDEAYTMNDDFNTDIDADEFHEQSLKINVPIIKDALKRRFRSEQIARLGNIHIIYPAFDKKSFQKIIQLELKKIAKKVKKSQNIQLKFDKTLHELIYNEGVYPTQGTRPIFTTIHYIVQAKLGKLITEMLLNNISAETIVLKFANKNVIAEYYNGKKKLHQIELPQRFTLEHLRENKQDDVQAITAVHEAGHAIISAILLQTVPEVVYSNTTEVSAGGFVYTKFKWKYISRKEIINRLALFLAGYVAEKVVFGNENVTIGAENDIEKATEFITKMLKRSGMGEFPIAYSEQHFEAWTYIFDTNNELNNEAKSWLINAMKLAESTLIEQETLLLQMANYLSDNRQLKKNEVTEFLKKYAVNFDMNTLIEQGDLLFYRNHLKEKVKQL